MMKKQKYNVAFGRVIQTLRAQKTWSQEMLGFEASVSRTNLSLIERGQRSPTLDTMIRLCDALGVRFGALAVLVEADIEKQEVSGND